MRKISAFLAFFLLMGIAGFSQNGLKKNGLGVNLGLIDFESAKDISKNEIGEFFQVGKRMKFALGVTYWKGLTKNIDLSVGYVGSFLDYPFENRDPYGENKLLSELDVAAHLRMFKESARVNPFLTAGVGGSLYGSEFGAFAPLGTGLQFNIGDGRTFATAQAQYRLHLTDNTTDHLYYSLGLHQNFGRKEVAAPPPPIPAVAPVDTDGDGVLDIEDLCPTVAGKAQFKGCPDTDNDGIQDSEDKCPQQAGVAKYQGCPVPDTDGDGINDENDKCPQQPGVAQYQGCPIPDRDGDGINDDVDKCPDIKGVAAKEGCPDFMDLYKFDNRYVQFVTGSSKLTKAATAELDKLVRALNDYPTIKVNVDGHTDNTGKAESNMKLSDARAKSVVDYLVKKGISADRLVSRGYGQDKPIADNATKEGRAINRRVEFSNHALTN